jgi:hypothetical protein
VSVATAAVQDPALLRFMKAHGLLRRVASGRPFVAALGAPATARRRREAGNVLHLDGYYRLAVRRRGDGALEVGLLHGRRPDLADAAFRDDSAQLLAGWADLRAACRTLSQLTEPHVPVAVPPPTPWRPARTGGGEVRSPRLTLR